MKTLLNISLLCVAVAIAGCHTVGEEPVLRNPAERTEANRDMVHAYFDESVANAVVRQKTVYPYHFVTDTPVINELGERDLHMLAEHYKTNVMPHLTARNVLKEVKVYFDYDRANLRSETLSALDEAAELLEQNPNADLLITGHADARGSEEYNERLGARRAESVKGYLASKNIGAHRVRILSRGEEEASASESDMAGMQEDRHAQFMVAELQEFPVDLNIRQGGASNQLYSARKKAVGTFLTEQGVDVAAINLQDGLPGGNGISSTRVVVVLTNIYRNGSGKVASNGSAAAGSGGKE